MKIIPSKGSILGGIQQVNAGMTKCSNYAHDRGFVGGVAVPDPDELLADIMALETWRLRIEKRGEETAKRRKAGPIAADQLGPN